MHTYKSRKITHIQLLCNQFKMLNRCLVSLCFIIDEIVQIQIFEDLYQLNNMQIKKQKVNKSCDLMEVLHIHEMAHTCCNSYFRSLTHSLSCSAYHNTIYGAIVLESSPKFMMCTYKSRKIAYQSPVLLIDTFQRFSVDQPSKVSDVR